MGKRLSTDESGTAVSSRNDGWTAAKQRPSRSPESRWASPGPQFLPQSPSVNQTTVIVP
ncbi:uncharacterized protein K441DRAFT_656467, partial [Cenococcum geophilum 1.58]|uniref:uncharacterized protein n=1 Tax=Cenococcum geophilum 1.58 TaxID=794803 RepID=UPI00358E7192